LISRVSSSTHGSPSIQRIVPSASHTSTTFGLASGVWTTDLAKAHRTAARALNNYLKTKCVTMLL